MLLKGLSSRTALQLLCQRLGQSSHLSQNFSALKRWFLQLLVSGLAGLTRSLDPAAGTPNHPTQSVLREVCSSVAEASWHALPAFFERSSSTHGCCILHMCARLLCQGAHPWARDCKVDDEH